MSEPPAPAGPPSNDAGAPAPPRLLRNDNFRRLWVGTVTAAGGTAVGSIVLTWLIYSTTHSALAVSLLGIVQFLPTLGFGLLAGALIDRLDRRRLMLTCDVGRCVCFGVLALYVLLVGVNVAVLLGAVFAVATFSTVFRPATNAALPRILPRAQLTDGNGLLQGGSTIAQFVGSPVGGVLILVVGAAAGLFVNALTFAVSGSMIFLMVIPAAALPPGHPAAPRRSLLGEVGDGLRFVRSQRALLIITFTSMAANFFFSIWGAFSVIYAGEHLHQGAAGFSILIASSTAGFAVGAILPGRLGFDRAPGLWLLPTWGISGLFVLGLAGVSTLGAAVGLTAVAGALLSMGNTTWLSGVQRTIPDAFLGRYFATDEAGSFAMIPAGIAVGGLIVFEYGIVWAYVVAGLGAFAVNLPLFFSPTVRAWGRRPDPAAVG